MADVKINGNNIGAGVPGSHVGDQKGVGTDHSKDKPDSSEHHAPTGNGRDSHAAGNQTDKQSARQSELNDQGRQARAKIEAQVSKGAKHDVPASLARDAKEAKNSNGNRVAREPDTRTSVQQSEQPRSRDNTSEKSTRAQNSSLDQLDKHSTASRSAQHEHNDASSIVDYLRGAKDGSSLTQDMRKVLDGAARAAGRNDVAAFVEKHGENAAKFIERTLHQADNIHDFATSHGGRAAGAAVQQKTIDELVSIVGLGKHFKELEKTGGDIGRRAEDAAMRLLFHESGDHSSRGVSAAEIMRDLHTGAFLPAREVDNPFPLTGRARDASEAMELMRTLDAIENALRQLESRRNPATQGGGLEAGALHMPNGQISTGDPDLDALLALIAKSTNGEEIPGGLPLLMAALPGRAGQLETARFIAGLNGALTDASGAGLLRAADGSPLKLGELLWLGVAGNLLAASFKADNFPTHLSPLLTHGFDALYSVIGFDGRTLAPPRFVAVEVQINASELEWVYGQPPLSEGWMRSMIERLKDSVAPDHNVLGETLEEALAGGRFDAVLIQGAVEAGTPVSESFKVAAHTPAKNIEPPLVANLGYA